MNHIYYEKEEITSICKGKFSDNIIDISIMLIPYLDTDLISCSSRFRFKTDIDHMKSVITRIISDIGVELTEVEINDICNIYLLNIPSYKSLSFNDKFNFLIGELLLHQYYIFKSECIIKSTDGKHSHKWDYVIRNSTTDNQDIEFVIDLDGGYYHGDSCDYSDTGNQQMYDIMRYKCVPENAQVIICYEDNLVASCDYMEELILMPLENRELYRRSLVKKLFPKFPYPRYSDELLSRSYKQLLKLYEREDIDYSAINNREGDMIIHHFHHSIYDISKSKKSGIPSAFWSTDIGFNMLMNECIMIHNVTNPNKLTQSFNVSRIAPKVTVFSAGRAKLLINKYLSEFNTVFDPFSGFSGRMLGTISLGKEYIGQDIGQWQVKESNKILEYIQTQDDSVQADVQKQDILKSRGSYECLFTCPPYGNKEQWLGVDLINKSCDEWIEECLKRFKCKRYVFVVDKTEKFKDYIVEEITNKSHLALAKEYVIMI